MPYFCKLRAPEAYQACEWDLSVDAAGREAWREIFAEHLVSLIEHARRSDHPPAERALAAFRQAFEEVLARVGREPRAYGRLTIYTLCALRAELMRQFGIGDPYDRVKREENEAALRRLPDLLAALDRAGGKRIAELLLRGVLAGNKFDLGAKDTADLHAAGGLDFFETLDSLAPRPWFIDQVDTIVSRLTDGACPYRKAMFFVDNAGGDVVLGALPLARHLADLGGAVVLAANDEPSLNDVTVDELRPLLDRAAQADERLGDHVRAGRITVVGTGCDCPLIDLADVSDSCNAAAADCDLLIIEGMGRAVETNLDARFTCDAIHLAMIKNRHVAGRLGCGMFDLIAQFRAGE